MPSATVYQKSVLITGASQGLGLSLCQLSLQNGCANLTLVARDKRKLSLALSELRKKFPDAVMYAISADVSTAEGAERAVALCASKVGCPEVVFLCAGAATPELFVNSSVSAIQSDMSSSYFTAAYTAHAVVRHMVACSVKGKLVFVSSVAGLPSGLPGYSSYAPAKHALRGLADTLYSELQMYGISTHIFFPASILGKSYRHELKTRPELMNVVEGADDGLEPIECAKILLKGLDRRRYMITTEIFGGMLAAQSRGGMPGLFFLLEFLWGLLGFVVLPVLRWMMITRPVRKYAVDNSRKISTGAKELQISNFKGKESPVEFIEMNHTG